MRARSRQITPPPRPTQPRRDGTAKTREREREGKNPSQRNSSFPVHARNLASTAATIKRCAAALQAPVADRHAEAAKSNQPKLLLRSEHARKHIHAVCYTYARILYSAKQKREEATEAATAGASRIEGRTGRSRCLCIRVRAAHAQLREPPLPMKQPSPSPHISPPFPLLHYTTIHYTATIIPAPLLRRLLRASDKLACAQKGQETNGVGLNVECHASSCIAFFVFRFGGTHAIDILYTRARTH